MVNKLFTLNRLIYVKILILIVSFFFILLFLISTLSYYDNFQKNNIFINLRIHLQSIYKGMGGYTYYTIKGYPILMYYTYNQKTKEFSTQQIEMNKEKFAYPLSLKMSKIIQSHFMAAVIRNIAFKSTDQNWLCKNLIFKKNTRHYFKFGLARDYNLIHGLDFLVAIPPTDKNVYFKRIRDYNKDFSFGTYSFFCEEH